MDVKVKQLLKAKGDAVWTVGPDENVVGALKVMADKNIGAVMVTEGEHLVGIFSERDLARKVANDEKPCNAALVRELMSTNIVSITGNTTIQECLSLMTEHRIRHLPVVENDKLRGVVSIGDVVKHIISFLELTVRDLENYITGSSLS